MKKIVSVLIAVVAAVGLCFGVAGCKDENANLTEQERLELNIRKDYVIFHELKKEEISYKDVIIDEYCGEYNNAHAVYITVTKFFYFGMEHEETVDGIKFVYPVINTITVYKDKSFYSLQEAFDNGLINHENLVKIAEKHYEYEPSLENNI